MAMSTTRKVVLTIIGDPAWAWYSSASSESRILVSAIRGEQPSIRDNSVLALRVSGPLPDYVPDNPLNRIFGESAAIAQQPDDPVSQSESRQTN